MAPLSPGVRASRRESGSTATTTAPQGIRSWPCPYQFSGYFPYTPKSRCASSIV